MKSAISQLLVLFYLLIILLAYPSAPINAQTSISKNLTAEPTKKASDLPIMIATRADGGMIPYFNSIAKDDDIIVFIHGTIQGIGIEAFKELVAQVNRGKIAYDEVSWQKAEIDTDSLKGLVDYLEYDLEKWPAANGEWQDISGSSKVMSQLAHNNGFNYIGGLSYSLGPAANNVEAMAQYTDEYAIFAQPFFKQGDLAGFVRYARDTANRARSSNPNVKIQLIVNTVWETYSMRDLYEEVVLPSLDFIDSVGIYHLTGGTQAEGRLKELVSLMRNPDTPSPTIGNCPKKNIGDADCDGLIDGTDYSVWLNSQCRTEIGQICDDTRADFNSDSNIDNADYDIWYLNRE